MSGVYSYVLSERIEDFGSSPAMNAQLSRLMGHLPADEVQAISMSWSSDSVSNIDPQSFFQVTISQANGEGVLEEVADSGRIFGPLLAYRPVSFTITRGLLKYMEPLSLDIQTVHNASGGKNAPWEGIGDLNVTIHLKSQREGD